MVVLKRFKKAVGVGRIYGPYTSSNPRAKRFSKYQTIAHHETVAVFKLLAPYLSAPKRRQYRAALKNAKVPAAPRPYYKRPTHCPQGHLYNKENTGWKKKREDYSVRYCKVCARERAARNYAKRR